MSSLAECHRLLIITFLMSRVEPQFNLRVLAVRDEAVSRQNVRLVAVVLPVRVVDLLCRVHVQPQLFLSVVSHALVLLVKSVERTTNNVVQCL